MLEKSITSLMAQIVSNVAGLRAELKLPVKAKKLWKTSHTFTFGLHDKFDLGKDMDDLASLMYSPLNSECNEKSSHRIIVEIPSGANRYLLTFEITEEKDSAVALLKVAPIIEDFPIYTSEFAHNLSGFEFSTVTRIVHCRDVLGLDLPEAFCIGCVKSIQKTAYNNFRKAKKEDDKTCMSPNKEEKKLAKKEKKIAKRLAKETS